MPDNKKLSPQFHPSLIDLSKTIGDFIQYWGFNRTHGQIWCLVYLSQQPLSGQIIAKALNLSKATVSLAIQELLFYEVIESIGRGDRRTLYYQSHPQVQSVIVNILKNRELKLIEKSNLALKALKKAEELEPQYHPILNHEKLEKLEQMIEQAMGFLNLLILTQLQNTFKVEDSNQ